MVSAAPDPSLQGGENFSALRAEKFSSVFSDTAKRCRFSGVVRISAGGTSEPWLSRAAGFSNRAERLRCRVDTRFASASGSKLFTAVAALQLVESGQLSLQDAVADWIDGFPFGPHITVFHLLTHTSGLPDYFDEEEAVGIDTYALLWEQRPVYAMQSARDFLPLFYTRAPKSLPGERFAYNNAAFLLLELIIERAGGVPFREAVQRRVLAPAGMTGSGYFYTDRLPGRTAQGYIPLEDGTYRTNVFAVPFIGGGDGGAYVTAPDWSRFWDALLDGKLLGPGLRAEMLRPQVPSHPRPGRHYGLGAWLLDSPLPRAAMAVGSDPGADMLSLCFLDQPLHLTILSNESDGASEMYRALFDLIIKDW